MKKKITALVWFLGSFAFSEPAYITFPSDVSWVTRESPHFTALYRSGQDTLAKRALKSAEKAHRLLTTIFKEAPEKTWLVLTDFHDSTNGYALNFPYPHIVVFTTPPESSNQLAPLDDWLDSVILHEFTHIVHLYPAHGVWGLMRTIFGTWVVPNGLMPNHLHEGMATFMETHFSRGGRGRGPLYRMYRRLAVEEGVWGKEFVPMDLLDGSSLRWPHGTSAYFFGYALTEELYRLKGDQGLWDLTLDYSDNWPYLLHGPPKKVYGKNYDEIWEGIYQRGEIEAKKEMASIRQKEVTPLKYLTHSKFYKWDTSFSPDGKLAAFRSLSPFKNLTIDILNLETGKMVDSLGIEAAPTEGLCFLGEQVLFSHTLSKNNVSTNTLYLWDRKEQSSRALKTAEGEIRNIRHLSCASSTNGIVSDEWGGVGHIREFSLKEKLVSWGREWLLPTGSWVNGLLSQKGRHWILLRENYETHLYSWEPGKDPIRWLTLPARASQPRAGKSEDSLYVLADIDDRNEVWEIFPKRKEIQKKVHIVGGLNAYDVSGNRLLATSYRHGGYDLVTGELKTGETKKISAPPPEVTESNEGVTISEEQSYSPLRTLLPHAWVPSVLFVPDGVQFGVWVPGFDISQKHLFDLYGGYDTRGLPFVIGGYIYRFGGTESIDISPYYSPSYLTSAKEFIKRWGGSIGFSTSALPFTTRLALLYRKIEQNPFGPEKQSIGIGTGISYKLGFSKRPYSISPVNGIKFGLSYDQYPTFLGSDDGFFTATASVDQFWAAPWWSDSVFFIGSRLGYTEGTYFINSYFEGGGETLFYQSRGIFLNRGFTPGYFIGRRLLNVNLEYRFPIARIERGWGLSPFFLNDIHAALVADTTSVDAGVSSNIPASLFHTFYTSAGFELRSGWKVSYYLPAHLRLGVYHGFGNSAGAEPLYFTVGAEAGL